tara:strand:- start:8082 stop:8867 length:786 start_codon:yes stop_codon:yes gene_type:complete
MAENNTDESFYIIKNVKASYPRINQTYKFDPSAGKKGKSVPCDPLDGNARYETDFIMDKDQAKELYGVMNKAYLTAPKRDDSWDKKLEMPFKAEEDEDGKQTGNFIGKAVIKGAYNNEPVAKPPEYDSKRNLLPEDFLLTTGSTVNIFVKLWPYSMTTTGVSLRLLAVQVLHYIPYIAPSPFGEEEGFSYQPVTADEPTGVDVFDIDIKPPPVEKTPEETPEDDPFEEPVKRASKQAAADTPSSKAKLASVIDAWADDKGK